ncbi:MAG: LysM peptidoglycan-binding domain-containing protein, partial [Chloroflexota bacterium]|nr:LysM peptidoglycan-binding domain-containing protein [Chloroflexota bacterium]
SQKQTRVHARAGAETTAQTRAARSEGAMMQNDYRRVLIGLGLIIPLFVGIALFAAPSASADTPMVHVVGWGDTLFSIATRYGMSVSALAQANGLRDPNFIWIGERLTIPGGAAPSPQSASTYVVQSGDTLFSIATRNGTTVSAVMQANGLYNYWIYVGQTLRIPGQFLPPAPQPQPQPQGADYVVRPGDYLAMVASRFGSSVYAIQISNRLPNPSFIWVGQRLFIPGGVAPVNPLPYNPLPPIYPRQPIYVPPVLPPLGQPMIYPPLPTLPPYVPPTATPLPPVVPAVVQPAPVTSVSNSGIWEAVLLTNTVGTGPCSLGAFVMGKDDWPVVVATTDGSWISDPKYTGNKLDRGPYYVEFAHACTGIWRVIPLGLNVYADVQLKGGHAEVEFHQRP